MSNDLITRPTYLPATEKPMGMEGAKRFMVPPRLKLIQPQSKAPFSELFDKGDVVVLPQRLIVAPIQKTATGKSGDIGTPFHFIPVFWFPEWCIWNPIKMAGTLPAVRERTFDAQSDIARKSRSKSTWFEPCPENPDLQIRYVEHLNFAIMLLGDRNPIPGMPCIISFSRGSHRTGSTLLSLIQVRQADIFACQFEMVTSIRHGQESDYYGYDVSNPSEASGVDPWVRDTTMYNKLKELFMEFKEAHDSATLIVEHDDGEDSEEFVDEGQAKY